MEYQVERFEDVIEEILPLLEAHWREVELYQDKINFNPDFNQYRLMQDMGLLHIVTVRDKGLLVGYFVSVMAPNIHHKDHTFATNDILYVDKDYRGRMLGARMFAFAEKELKKLGVDVIVIHTKTHMDFKPLLERLGYSHIEQCYGKYIGE